MSTTLLHSPGMDDELDLQEREPDSQTPPATKQLPRRRAAREVYRSNGVTTLVLIAWMIWCVRDGWFRPGYEHIGFSRICAYGTLPFLLYNAVMTISAARTLLREKHQPPTP